MKRVKRLVAILAFTLAIGAGTITTRGVLPAAAGAPNGCYAGQEANAGFYFVYPPGNLVVYTTGKASVSCSYVTGGTSIIINVAYHCEALSCVFEDNGAVFATGSLGTSGNYPAFSGDTITVIVAGGWGAAFDGKIPQCVPSCTAASILAS